MQTTPTVIEPEARQKADTVARLCNLPRMNPTASRLLAVSSDSDNAFEEFRAIFSGDPSLAVELLRAANSAQFGLRATVSNLRVALMVLGTDGTRNLAVTIALSSYARARLSKTQIRPIWLHSLATAVIAEEIGRCVAPSLTDLYTAGLTHDLGRLGLLCADSQGYGNTLGKAYSSIDEASAVERVIFGLTHAEAGALLAQTWGFPTDLCRSIRTHHDCLADHEGRLLRINQHACILAAELGYPELQNCPVPEAAEAILEGYRDYPALSHERLNSIILRRTQEA